MEPKKKTIYVRMGETMLYDSHTHINEERYTDIERQEVIKKIEDSIRAGILSYVNDIGCTLETSRMAVEHAERYNWCYSTVGIHPHWAAEADDMTLMMIKSLAKKRKVVAIGEIGLDFYYDNSPRDIQRDVFRKQIKIANELKLPIVIHSREADQETLEILKEESAFSDLRKSWFSARPTPAGWSSASGDAKVLLHCYSGSSELASQYVRLGGWISIAGPVTFKNNKKTVKVVKEIPAEFLMVETDAPYLTPEPFRGKPNISPYVEHTARRVGVIKDIEFEEICRITTENAKRFFGVK